MQRESKLDLPNSSQFEQNTQEMIRNEVGDAANGLAEQ